MLYQGKEKSVIGFLRMNYLEQADVLDHKNDKLFVEGRGADLLAYMTLEEKNSTVTGNVAVKI
jgi:hypothetical protein